MWLQRKKLDSVATYILDGVFYKFCLAFFWALDDFLSQLNFNYNVLKLNEHQ